MESFRLRLQPGEILAGKYQVERVLGEGGMGFVVAAHHLQLETRVAIKLLLPEMAGNPEAVSRFLREARAAARITNEHVVRVTDVGTLESGAPYMVMEYLEGADLAEVLRSSGAMSVEQAVALLLEACEALADAHAAGIVHRDLKPANLFWVERADGSRSLKVLDFGISKVLNKAATGASTQTSALLGTPYYMSPEQMTSSRDVDARTDIWALGVILYQLLANDLPFDGDTLPAVCVSVATAPPASLRSRRPDLSAELEALILRCLEKDPNRRFANVKELALALASHAPTRAPLWIERTGSAARLKGARSSRADLVPNAARPIAAVASGTVAPFQRTNHEMAARPGRAKSLVALISFLTLGAGAVAFWFLRSRPPAPAAVAAPAAPTPIDRATSRRSEPKSAATQPLAAPNVVPVEREAPPVVAPIESGKRSPASLSQVTAAGPAFARKAPKAKASHPAAAVYAPAGGAAQSATPEPAPVKAQNSSSAFDDRE